MSLTKGTLYLNSLKQVKAQSKFVGLVNLDFGKYKNVSHYGFNAVCKEKQYDWVCYCLPLSDSS